MREGGGSEGLDVRRQGGQSVGGSGRRSCRSVRVGVVGGIGRGWEGGGSGGGRAERRGDRLPAGLEAGEGTVVRGRRHSVGRQRPRVVRLVLVRPLSETRQAGRRHDRRLLLIYYAHPTRIKRTAVLERRCHGRVAREVLWRDWRSGEPVGLCERVDVGLRRSGFDLHLDRRRGLVVLVRRGGAVAEVGAVRVGIGGEGVGGVGLVLHGEVGLRQRGGVEGLRRSGRK